MDNLVMIILVEISNHAGDHAGLSKSVICHPIKFQLTATRADIDKNMNFPGCLSVALSQAKWNPKRFEVDKPSTFA